MKYRIQGVHVKTDDMLEFTVDYKESSYLVIVGKHVNGWFIAIPNWKKSVEAGHPECEFYNFEKLTSIFDEVEASLIASAICFLWMKEVGHEDTTD